MKTVCKTCGVPLKYYDTVSRIVRTKGHVIIHVPVQRLVFSPKFENIINSNYMESMSSLKTTTLIGGEGEGSARRYTIVGGGSDLYRRELFTDARDIQSDEYSDKLQKTEENLTKWKESLKENEQGLDKINDEFNTATYDFDKATSEHDSFVHDYNIRIDYWLRCGDTECTTHHLVIMPDVALYNAQMNTTNTTEGGYINSAMYKTNIANAKTIVKSAFGSTSILTHREWLTNAVSNGKPSGGGWFNSDIEIPCEIQMYGHLHFSPTSDGSSVPAIYTVNKSQFALFAACPKFITDRSHNQWFRDVVSSASFAVVNDVGPASYAGASFSYGVRPVCGIVG